MEKKRPFIDYGDLLIVLGTGLLIYGLILLDYRWAIVAAGLLLTLFGGLRLRSVQ